MLMNKFRAFHRFVFICVLSQRKNTASVLQQQQQHKKKGGGGGNLHLHMHEENNTHLSELV